MIRELEDGKLRKAGSLQLIKDLEVQLTKNRNEHWKFAEEKFRLTIARNPESGTEYWFLTNMSDITVEEVLLHYKQHWDIEVFFKFLKQELNLSHITSTNPNGIAVMMYI